ncbi:MAG: phosphoglycerate kinase [Acidobacteria bacterium]|nr:phosphoglycerate kinase [Acidobacteriota bacterium]
MSIRSIRNLDLAGKRVLIRADFNVPLADGAVGDDTRIRASLPTIRYALERGATVVLASHLGRPKGNAQAALSLGPVAGHLSDLLGQPVRFASDCVGEAADTAVAAAHPGGVVLLENLRFHAGEERNEAAFAAALGALADVYVNDAFGAAHRAHASTTGVVAHVADAGAGLLMGAELDHLGSLLGNPARPFAAVLGGAKVSGKLDVIENLLGRVDALLIGGAMAYTFFARRGLPVGKSLVEPDLLEAAAVVERDARRAGVDLRLPSDHVVTARIAAGADTETLDVRDAAIGDRLGVDIGPGTSAAYATVIGGAGTVVWNGPMGVFEIDAFAAGTLAVARAVAETAGTTVVGGGDSVAAVANAGVRDQINHISTGGGASLEFLAGRPLPGVSALPDS